MADRTCSVDDCGGSSKSLGLCPKHYNRFRRLGTTHLEFPYGCAVPPCSIEGCSEPGNNRGHGWCAKHHRRYQRHGDPHATSRIVGDDLARFESNLEAGPDGCWLWTGPLTDDGYGVFVSDLPSWLAHRWSYRHHIADLDGDLELDHLCRVRHCVNPWHLEQVPHRVNILRGESPQAINARKTHCKHGHEFTPENTYVPPGANGPDRRCRVCIAANAVRRVARDRAAAVAA